MDESIVIDGVSKKYLLGNSVSFARSAKRCLRFLTSSGRVTTESEREEFWALRNVSFDVKKGEILGIIGSNGAGKSTLLKILSRITAPTEGRVLIRGRVSSLLEVGTGFNPELTGRENIYMNGSILGLERTEIDRKLPEIAEFSGVGKFLETPIKRYSSGMTVRLGFSVAAHLEPEVLIVDEVLAVGDADFQRKCLGRLDRIRSTGRTVLFVSHSMESVANLCERVVWLDKGQVREIGPARKVIASYLNQSFAKGEVRSLRERQDRTSVGDLKFTEAFLVNSSGQIVKTTVVGEDIGFFLKYESSSIERFGSVKAWIGIENGQGSKVVEFHTSWTGQDLKNVDGMGGILCKVPRIGLTPGTYSASISIRGDNFHDDDVRNAITFEVQPGDYYRSGGVLRSKSVVYFDCSWSAQSVIAECATAVKAESR